MYSVCESSGLGLGVVTTKEIEMIGYSYYILFGREFRRRTKQNGFFERLFEKIFAIIVDLCTNAHSKHRG